MFRVWDNINKRYDTDLSLIDKDGDLCYQDGHKYCNGEHSEDFTIEQCTGVKDKNGKLIYEGDKVRILKTILYVAWNGATYFLHPDGVELTQDVMRRSTPLCWYMVHYRKEIEVIGNIHEMESEND